LTHATLSCPGDASEHLIIFFGFAKLDSHYKDRRKDVTDSPDLRNSASPNPESKESDKKKDLTDFTDKKKEPTDSINSKKTEPTESKKKEAKPELTEDEKSKLRSLHASDKPSSELDGDEQKGVKRLGIPTTQEKLASSNPDSPKSDRLGLSETGSFANPNESIVPPHGDDEPPKEPEKSDEDKFISSNNPDFSPGYMHDRGHGQQEVSYSESDKAKTVSLARRVAPTRNQPFIPEPLIGNEKPDLNILPQNREDLMATINSILKVTSADSQQLEIALVRIASQIPVNYTPRAFASQNQE
jgi:hypothetical protein